VNSVTEREANQRSSDLLARVEQGEDVLITKRGRPIAVLSPYQHQATIAERESALSRALALMDEGLPWGEALQPFARDEMHER
jgi:prevent-host-death family protein